MKQNQKNYKSKTVYAALILTFFGILSRIIGFFYRIFLSNTIGAEGMGLYQLILPAASICYAICTGSFQTAISWFVASSFTQEKKHFTKQEIILTGLFLSLSFSVITSIILYENADHLASRFLLEPRCSGLLRYFSFSLPLSAIHACIAGFYYGQKKAAIPALSQFLEQIGRVTCVFFFWLDLEKTGRELTPAFAVLGIAAGELCAVLFLFLSILFGILSANRKKHLASAAPHTQSHHFSFWNLAKNMLVLAIPLSANRLLFSVLSFIEAALIPNRLLHFGLSSSESLRYYGILTGMSLPFIFFPCALTNSLAVVLLPEIAEANSKGMQKRISSTIMSNIRFCLSVGILFTGLFFFFGKDMGEIIFHQKEAGIYIHILSLLCPFLYLTTTLGSILNGLGKTGTTLIHNCISLLVRIGFVFFLIPAYGMKAYLWGMEASQLLLTFLHLFSLRKQIQDHFSVFHFLIDPAILFFACLLPVLWLNRFILNRMVFTPLLTLGISVSLLLSLYFGIWILFSKKKLMAD